MKTVYHPAKSRGHANFGWLDTYHSFSFGRWYDPDRINFGALRVLNDDTVAPGKGFGEHPHDNMEIISIPLEGQLAHKDSTGGGHILHPNEIQVMSAGKGLTHSEYNPSEEEESKFLQIWIIPEKRGLESRYAEAYFEEEDRLGEWQQLVHPRGRGDSLWINQNAWISRAEISSGNEIEYQLHGKGQGVYVFMLRGIAKTGGHVLEARDGLGISEADKITLEASADSDILLVEVPMISLD